MLYALLLLLAQADPDKVPDQTKGPGSPFDSFMLPLLIVAAMFIFIVILPAQQRREKKQRESLLANLKKNDEVVTAAGIIGVVTNIKEGADEVTLRIDDNAKMRVLKSTIVKINSRESTPGT
jgi:preprotein translocase subunit YajC